MGAPGVGNDAGTVYIMFGSDEYTAASYTLGSIGADGSFILNAPSDNGYGGFSVAGTGKRSPSIPFAVKDLKVSLDYCFPVASLYYVVERSILVPLNSK